MNQHQRKIILFVCVFMCSCVHVFQKLSALSRFIVNIDKNNNKFFILSEITKKNYVFPNKRATDTFCDTILIKSPEKLK